MARCALAPLRGSVLRNQTTCVNQSLVIDVQYSSKTNSLFRVIFFILQMAKSLCSIDAFTTLRHVHIYYHKNESCCL